MPSPSDNLPPVEPPNPKFLMQLFGIPLLIVVVIVLVSLMFNWLAHMGTRPEKLVDDLAKLNAGSWQDALTIANLLTDRRNAELRRDEPLCNKLSQILDQQLTNGSLDPDRVRLRVYLCLTLGAFEIDQGVPMLIRALETQRDPVEVDVQKTALESLARLGDVSDTIRDGLVTNDRLWEAMRNVAGATAPSPELGPLYAQLRGRAAYALGVVGGPRAIDLLAGMLADADSSVRYNAAIGLARHGDARCVPRLTEMVRLAHVPAATASAAGTGEPLNDIERTTIVKNGIRAGLRLREKNSTADLTSWFDVVRELGNASDVPAVIRRGVSQELSEVRDIPSVAP